MPQKNKTSFDRVLLGPNAYDRFDKISKICQKRYLNLIKAQSLVLILIAILSSFSITTAFNEQLVRFAIVALSIIVLGLIIYQQNKNYMMGWQNARFIAESVLSNSWLFCFKIGIYNENEKTSKTNFFNTIEKIEKEVELKSFLSIYSSKLSPIAEWMQNLYNDPNINNKKEFYLKHRLNDQINWYTKKSELDMNNSNIWFTLSLILLLLGIILTLVIKLNQFSIFGFLSTVIAAILTWRQTKRFDELKVTFAVAAKELHSLKAKFELEHDEPDILKFIEESEKSISREHKLWFNWTYIT